MHYEASLSFARLLDEQDPLKHLREHYYFPKHQEHDCLYFCGNSLGLQPKGVDIALQKELEHWQQYGVEGHFRGAQPWVYYHKFLMPQVAKLVGAKEQEVVVMNTLTVNLHLMMISFYQPTADRFKIVMEAGAFPSDQYAVESQVKLHGFDPEQAIVEVTPRKGEDTIHTEDIVQTIQAHSDSIALVLFGGVNYYTGQFFDLRTITKAGHEVGAHVGFDLAHAAGNVPLELNRWGVDFAVWCSYKYLNAGPGGPSGAFVHERHADRPELPRLAGWWGHDEDARFQMQKGFIPMKGAAGWQLSNVPIFSFAAHKVSLDLFNEVGMDALRQKSELLTGYLEFLIGQLNKEQEHYKIITPSTPKDRGCQLSILTQAYGRELFAFLTVNGVICDWREPNVIRLAPAPMYNTFEDVFRLYGLLLEYQETKKGD
ncbi:MAG: kynureninase [Bacteroidota bacterium]